MLETSWLHLKLLLHFERNNCDAKKNIIVIFLPYYVFLVYSITEQLEISAWNQD